ncbi:MAG: hypothetical protein GF405_03855 [Candidatus Eisenbacteria bacterium]|nr:hypothetical protein [Candidatus Eisenbacteria bacterium]
MKCAILCFQCLLLLATACTAAVGPAGGPDGSGAVVAVGGLRVIETRAGNARRGLALPDTLVVAGTDTVRLEGRVLERGTAYLLDAGTRRFRLMADAPDSAAVRLSYRYLPGASRAVFRTAFLDSAGSLPEEATAAQVIVAEATEDRPAIGPDLRVDGSKTFGITVGSNRDPTLEQSLRINAVGRIAGDVSVRAYLSDQNTPLRPEGDTEELRALDEVLVELESPQGRATLGDLVLSTRRSVFATVERELTGAQVEGRLGPGSFLLAGARADGEFASVTFRGVEGKQGQYVLGSGDPVVAGSERVWIDGERARRGRDNDYVIDYDAGAIEFTETNPITADTEISVDYESASGAFTRDLYAISGGFGDEGLFGVTWLREADDSGSPSSVVIGDDERAILAEAGDDPLEAFDAGVDSVGPGLGDYERLAEGIYEYAGRDSGSFDLAFERSEGGAYEYDYVGGYYVHVGEGVGTHRLGQSLPLPVAHDIVAVNGAGSLGPDGWVEAEGAVSRYDANTLSDLDDDDNVGNAASLSAGTRTAPLTWLAGGTLTASLSGRRVAGAFRAPGRFREVGYEERWELTGLDLPDGEAMARGDAELSFPEGGELSLSHAALRRGDDVSTSRSEFAASGRPLDGVEFSAMGRLVDVSVDGAARSEDRTRRLYRAALDRAGGTFRPGLRYARDRRTTDGDGERYDEFGGQLRVVGGGRLSGHVSYDHRVTDRSDAGVWKSASTTTTEEYRLTWDGGRRLSAEIFARRRRSEQEGASGDPGTRHDLVRARLAGSSGGGLFKGELRYTVTTTEVEEKEKYVTEEDGVEVTRIISTGNYLPVTELEAVAGWRVDGRAGRGRLPEATPLRRLLSSLSVRSDVKLKESTTTDDRWGLYRLDPGVIQSDDTVEGDIISRHSVRYVSAGGGASARLTVETRDELDRQFENAPERRTVRSAAVDVKLSPSNDLTWRILGEAARRERESDGAIESYRIDERTVEGEMSLRRFGDVELRLTALVGGQDEEVEGVSLRRYEITPGLTWRFRGRGALIASVTRAEVETDADDLPLYLGAGRGPGGTTLWRLSGDYRVNSYLTATLSYTGERREGREAVQTADLRVSAYF